jgi:hypothetical protein
MNIRPHGGAPPPPPPLASGGQIGGDRCSHFSFIEIGSKVEAKNLWTIEICLAGSLEGGGLGLRS